MLKNGISKSRGNTASLSSNTSGATTHKKTSLNGQIYSFVDQTHIDLSCGLVMPQVGLGTWKSEKGEVKSAVEKSIRMGYRAIDCAAAYENEDEVGEGLAEIFSEGVVSRSDLFITSKLWNDMHDRVKEAAEKSIKDLQCQYLDLFLMHWPANPSPAATLKTYAAMEDLVSCGLVKAIGVSNFSIQKLKILLGSPSLRIKPCVVQVEGHPYWPNQDLIDFCTKQDIKITCYAPLGSPDSEAMEKRDPDSSTPLTDKTIVEIAERMSKNPGQVLIRWAIQRGCCVLPKSVHEGRIKTNFEVFDWALSTDDMATLSTLPHREKMVGGSFLVAKNQGGEGAKEGDDRDDRPYPTLLDLWDEET